VRVPRHLWLTLFAVAALAVLVSLGVWQLRRLAWKQDLIERVTAAASAEPRPLEAALRGGGNLHFVRVRAACPGLDRAPFVELYAVVDGQAGTRLISACPTQGGEYGSVLVDRGFVADTVSWRPPQDGGAEPVEVTGVLQASGPASPVAADDDPARGRFYTRAVPSIAAALKAPRPAPVFLMAETPTADSAALRPLPTSPDLPNRHLEYALTWFGLAGALVAVYAAVLIQDRRRARAPAMSG
jgi:surfeit locus 1 family protein